MSLGLIIYIVSCSPDSCIAEDNLGIYISDKALQCKTKSWRGLVLSSTIYVHAGNRLFLDRRCSSCLFLMLSTSARAHVRAQPRVQRVWINLLV